VLSVIDRLGIEEAHCEVKRLTGGGLCAPVRRYR